jgi:DNA polymerase III, alpha subunit
MLEGLIKTGAFDSTGAKRSQLSAVLDQAIENGRPRSANGISGRPIFSAMT